MKCYGEEHRMLKLNEFLSLSKGKTVSGRFQLIGLKQLKESKYFIGNKIVQIVIMEKFVVIVLKNPKIFVLIARWRELVTRICINVSKNCSTDINMLERKPPNAFEGILNR